MDPKTDFIQRILPYRLDAVEILGFAAQYRMEVGGRPVSMQIYLDGKLLIEGRSSAFTNPVLEGIIHCRALLEFLGLRADRSDPHEAYSTSRAPS